MRGIQAQTGLLSSAPLLSAWRRPRGLSRGPLGRPHSKKFWSLGGLSGLYRVYRAYRVYRVFRVHRVSSLGVEDEETSGFLRLDSPFAVDSGCKDSWPWHVWQCAAQGLGVWSDVSPGTLEAFECM